MAAKEAFVSKFLRIKGLTSERQLQTFGRSLQEPAQRIGLSGQELCRLLPSELTPWVDPYEVSRRTGEVGSICVLHEASPAGGSTQNSTDVQTVDSRISCKEELLLDRTSPSKHYSIMTVSG
ncbi:Protein BTG1, partial [Eschrichtius robustus]|nr:Protein BTG1 [Eschrichtius robustus]